MKLNDTYIGSTGSMSYPIFQTLVVTSVLCNNIDIYVKNLLLLNLSVNNHIRKQPFHKPLSVPSPTTHSSNEDSNTRENSVDVFNSSSHCHHTPTFGTVAHCRSDNILAHVARRRLTPKIGLSCLIGSLTLSSA